MMMRTTRTQTNRRSSMRTKTRTTRTRTRMRSRTRTRRRTRRRTRTWRRRTITRKRTRRRTRRRKRRRRVRSRTRNRSRIRSRSRRRQSCMPRKTSRYYSTVLILCKPLQKLKNGQLTNYLYIFYSYILKFHKILRDFFCRPERVKKNSELRHVSRKICVALESLTKRI